MGAVAISGLPPLNGFVSELLIFSGAFHGVTTTGNAVAVAGLAVIVGLALIGGLAAACFAKAFGIVFLGVPRSEHAAHAHESGWTMRWPMALLAVACFGVSLVAPVVLRGLWPVLVQLTVLPEAMLNAPFASATFMLTIVALLAMTLIFLIISLVLFRRVLLSRRQVSTVVTWDCGYARLTARRQYTASSFAQPFTKLFHGVLQTRAQVTPLEGPFPKNASLATETSDFSHAQVYRPAFIKLGWGLARFRWLQHGKVQLYVLYIALTLIVLIAWKLR